MDRLKLEAYIQAGKESDKVCRSSSISFIGAEAWRTIRWGEQLVKATTRVGNRESEKAAEQR